MKNHGFTLVELLVVITIIVVLLSLLAPALDRAVYQAELAVCGANYKALGAAVLSYAMNHRKSYPYRDAAEKATAWPASKLSGGNVPNDVRRVIAGYIPINKMLVDPLCLKVDLETDAGAGEQVFASINLWFGWKTKGEKQMRRLGDRFTYGDRSFNIIAGDADTFDYSKRWVQSSHPDEAGKLTPWLLKYTTEAADPTGVGVPGLALTLSMWVRAGQAERGLTDNNVLFADGAVARYAGVESHTDTETDADERMTRFPWLADNTAEASRQWTYLPAN